MPGSYRWFDPYALKWIEENFQSGIRVLDVGAGTGKYADYLQQAVKMDALEPYEPYIMQYKLNDKYRHVYCMTAQKFFFVNKCCGNEYDLVIFADVLEHLAAQAAKNCIDFCIGNKWNILAQVPFLYKQGHIKDDDYEKHLQDDLTPQIMHHRFPKLVPLKKDDVIGIYVYKAGR